MNRNYDNQDEKKFYSKYGSILEGKCLHDRHENYLEEISIVKKYVLQGRYLDVGCNAGWLLQYLKQETSLELYGLEPSKFLAQLAEKRLGIKIINRYIEKDVLESEYFDFISMTDVFEHIPEPHPVLELLHKSLKKGKYLMIKVPNVKFTYLKYRIKKFFPFLIMAKDSFDAKEHMIHYSKESLKRVLKDNGFKVIKEMIPKPVQTRNSPRATLWSRRIIYSLAKAKLFPSQDLLLVAQKGF